MQINPIKNHITNQAFKAKPPEKVKNYNTDEQVDAISAYFECIKRGESPIIIQPAEKAKQISLPENAIPITSEKAACIDEANKRLLQEIDELHTKIQKNYFTLRDHDKETTFTDIKNLKKVARNKYVALKRKTPESPAYKYMKVHYDELGSKDIQIVVDNTPKCKSKVYPIYENKILKLADTWNGRNLISYKNHLSLNNACRKEEFSNGELNLILKKLKEGFKEINSALEKKLGITAFDKLITDVKNAANTSKTIALLKKFIKFV